MHERAERQALLNEALRRLWAFAAEGRLGVPILYHDTILGPRACAILINCGADSGTAYQTLRAADCALARQIFPWHFTDIQVYWQGAWIRIEAPWPDHLAVQMVRLVDLWPPSGQRVIIGIDEYGMVANLELTRETPHALIAGTTGSGKTVLMRSIGAQLVALGYPVVLLDGKLVGLLPLQNAGNVLGPLAHEIEDVIAALSWLVSEMQRRYRVIAGKERPAGGEKLPIFVLWDEFQEHMSDKRVESLAFTLASRGAEARIHLVMATQHPLATIFGGEFGSVTKRQVRVRIALAVTDSKASEVVVGATEPDASKLSGAGDAYFVWPGGRARIQCAYVDENDIRNIVQLWGGPVFPSWPTTEISAAEKERNGKWYTPDEIAIAVRIAMEGRGRPALEKELAAIGVTMGTDRLRTLLEIGRAVANKLTDLTDRSGIRQNTARDTYLAPVSQANYTQEEGENDNGVQA